MRYSVAQDLLSNFGSEMMNDPEYKRAFQTAIDMPRPITTDTTIHAQLLSGVANGSVTDPLERQAGAIESQPGVQRASAMGDLLKKAAGYAAAIPLAPLRALGAADYTLKRALGLAPSNDALLLGAAKRLNYTMAFDPELGQVVKATSPEMAALAQRAGSSTSARGLIPGEEGGLIPDIAEEWLSVFGAEPGKRLRAAGEMQQANQILTGGRPMSDILTQRAQRSSDYARAGLLDEQALTERQRRAPEIELLKAQAYQAMGGGIRERAHASVYGEEAETERALRDPRVENAIQQAATEAKQGRKYAADAAKTEEETLWVGPRAKADIRTRDALTEKRGQEAIGVAQKLRFLGDRTAAEIANLVARGDLSAAQKFLTMERAKATSAESAAKIEAIQQDLSRKAAVAEAQIGNLEASADLSGARAATERGLLPSRVDAQEALAGLREDQRKLVTPKVRLLLRQGDLAGATAELRRAEAETQQARKELYRGELALIAPKAALLAKQGDLAGAMAELKRREAETLEPKLQQQLKESQARIQRYIDLTSQGAENLDIARDRLGLARDTATNKFEIDRKRLGLAESVANSTMKRADADATGRRTALIGKIVGSDLDAETQQGLLDMLGVGFETEDNWFKDDTVIPTDSGLDLGDEPSQEAPAEEADDGAGLDSLAQAAGAAARVAKTNNPEKYKGRSIKEIAKEILADPDAEAKLRKFGHLR